MRSITGGRLCGAVRFTVEADDARARGRHCDRRPPGFAPSRWADQLTWAEVAEVIDRYAADYDGDWTTRRDGADTA